jgi:hypothetical protein
VRRQRHRLDLLPLLDVFMVVLFVFATIQEQRLDETSRDADTLAQQLAATERELAAREADLARAAEDDEAEALRERLRAAEATLAELKADAEATIAGLASGDDAVRRQSVLAKLLDRYSVFEVEIAGSIDDTGAVVNHCCYRTDPLSTSWTSCGAIPPVAHDRAAWWDEGGGGLDRALRRTKGGNAMTIVRQDDRAGYRIAASMEELLRERFPDQQIYDEGVSLVLVHCAPAGGG